MSHQVGMFHTNTHQNPMNSGGDPPRQGLYGQYNGRSRAREVAGKLAKYDLWRNMGPGPP